VLQFITTHNRPWNVLGVSDHLAQFGVKKAQVQRALDTLSEGGKVTCKEFGKAKLYLPLQPGEAGLTKEARTWWPWHELVCFTPALFSSVASTLPTAGSLRLPGAGGPAAQQRRTAGGAQGGERRGEQEAEGCAADAERSLRCAASWPRPAAGAEGDPVRAQSCRG